MTLKVQKHDIEVKYSPGKKSLHSLHTWPASVKSNKSAETNLSATKKDEQLL